jgi:hypothetical protein
VPCRRCGELRALGATTGLCETCRRVTAEAEAARLPQAAEDPP